MPRKTISLRLDEGLLTWADEYAEKRGVNRTSVLEGALRTLQTDAKGGVPELDGTQKPAPKPERVPTPQETGTAHWREPSAEEIEDTRRRFARDYPNRPQLPHDRLMRLARAEAKLRDQGALPPAGELGRGDAWAKDRDGDRTREVGARESSFEAGTQSRVDLFSKLHTPASAKGVKPK